MPLGATFWAAAVLTFLLAGIQLPGGPGSARRASPGGSERRPRSTINAGANRWALLRFALWKLKFPASLVYRRTYGRFTYARHLSLPSALAGFAVARVISMNILPPDAADVLWCGLWPGESAGRRRAQRQTVCAPQARCYERFMGDRTTWGDKSDSAAACCHCWWAAARAMPRPGADLRTGPLAELHSQARDCRYLA